MVLSITRPFEVFPSRRGAGALRHFVLSSSSAGAEYVPLCGHGIRAIEVAFGVAQSIAETMPVAVLDPDGYGSGVERVTRGSQAYRAPSRDDTRAWHLAISLGPTPGHRFAVELAARDGVVLEPSAEMVLPFDDDARLGAIFYYGCHHSAVNPT